MIALTIRHRTTYLYHQPVKLGPHRLMLRPRESRDLRLISSDITVTPAATLSWAQRRVRQCHRHGQLRGHDRQAGDRQRGPPAAGRRPVAGVRHRRLGDQLSVPLLRRGVDRPRPARDAAVRGSRWTVEQVGGRVRAQQSHRHPVAVERPERRRGRAHPLPEPRGRGHPGAARDADRGWGSCRDFAVLFVDAARPLGFGARIISGYLYNPDRDRVGSDDAGSTHAWAEVYLPGAGWITFDPTNRGVGGHNLIPVAVARDIPQATPVTGSFVGMTDAFLGMTVEVDVSSRRLAA